MKKILYLLLCTAATQSLPAQATLPPDMVFVLGGTFTMGCTAEQQPDCFTTESPAHEVTLTDFYIGKYEVMQGQWTALFGANPKREGRRSRNFLGNWLMLINI